MTCAMLKMTEGNVITPANTNYGVLADIQESGSIATLIITIDGRDYPVLAERRITMNALADMFGDDWQGQPVQFNVDRVGLLWIAPRCADECATAE